MHHSWDIKVVGRLLIVLTVVILLDITPDQQVLTRRFQQIKDMLGADSPAEAAHLTAEIARQIPWRDDLWERAGIYAWQGDDFQSAIVYLEQAALSNNLTVEGRRLLADAYLQTGKPDKAGQLFLDMLKEGSNSEVYIQLFQVHRWQKEYLAALADMVRLTELVPENAYHYYVSGLLHMVLQPDQALTLLQHAAALNDDFAPTIAAIKDSLLLAQCSDNPAQSLMTHGRILAALQEWELAGEAFRQATLINPDNAAAWAFLGETRQHTNGPASVYANLYPLETPAIISAPADEEGWAELQRALALDPQLIASHVFLSLYWERHQRFDQALTSMENAIRLSPKVAALYSQKGSLQAMLGDLSGALASYQQAVELSDNDPQMLRLLLIFCITYEYQLSEAALPAARTLLQQDIIDPTSLDLAGQVLYMQKDPAAQKYLERALAQDPDFAPAHLHQGLLYLEYGELALAKEKFILAQSLAPGTSIAGQAQRLLETYFP